MPHPDFPRSIMEFSSRFATEAACERYLCHLRWPQGFVCPVCGDRESYDIKTRKVSQCKRNGHQTSLTAGTVMHGSHLPLRVWFWGAFLVATKTPGISAWQFCRQIGVTRYETSFNLLHKLRAAMVRPERGKLSRIVEVDETYIGGPTKGTAGRGTRRAVVVVAIERRNGHAGRVRLRKIKGATQNYLLPFIRENIELGSTVLTDGYTAYQHVGQLGYQHKPVAQLTPERAKEVLPLSHLIFSNLKTWINGTYHGVSKKHLQAYLNEFTFRFNRRYTPMAAFQAVLGIATRVEGPTYRKLYSGTWVHPNIKR